MPLSYSTYAVGQGHFLLLPPSLITSLSCAPRGRSEGQESEDWSQKTEVRMYGFPLPCAPIIDIRNNEAKMLRNYIQATMRHAKYEILPDDDSFYGEIPGFNGVYANAASLEKCREELEEVLEEWILMRVSRNLPLPVVEGIELVIKETA